MEEDRWQFLNDLDDEILKGGATFSEWCTFIVRDADIAFAAGAHLATIITAVAGIETYLRAEYAASPKGTLYQLIEGAPLQASLKNDLQILRRYRNKWVHISDPLDDQELLSRPENYECELERMAIFAVRVLRQTIYSNQWV
ncbi:hypothetical protein VB618_16620 [Microvirga sp. CF3062]|uniref:hypothetical protein n=1 Tax=Microvirga sp. CF3062 TaxID=3110182 RepID=UPI002E77016E|nr:hypothetical protein [Microvirga sp. CF3062]MEE1657827.1 hypothetical protein [Microvirga sp. CF3062]